MPVFPSDLPDDPRIRAWQDETGRRHLDVRELLLDGGEPYQHIMSAVNSLAPGETMTLHAIFEPVPLLRKLGRQGYGLASVHVGLDHWALDIRRPE